MTDDTESRSLLGEINITRIVAISFALSLLLTAGTAVALAAPDTDQTIDKNDSLFCKKADEDDTASPAAWEKGDWVHTVASDHPGPSQSNLGSIVETFVRFTFGAGLLGAFVVWQGTALGNMLSLDRSQKRKLKKYRGSATKSFGVLVLIGPLFTVITSVLGVGAVGCISLTFF